MQKNQTIKRKKIFNIIYLPLMLRPSIKQSDCEWQKNLKIQISQIIWWTLVVKTLTWYAGGHKFNTIYLRIWLHSIPSDVRVTEWLPGCWSVLYYLFIFTCLRLSWNETWEVTYVKCAWMTFAFSPAECIFHENSCIAFLKNIACSTAVALSVFISVFSAIVQDYQDNLIES